MVFGGFVEDYYIVQVCETDVIQLTGEDLVYHSLESRQCIVKVEGEDVKLVQSRPCQESSLLDI